MGVLRLNKLLAEYAPNAVKTNEIKNYIGRKIAIDASMSLHQFLIAVRRHGAQLMNSDGEVTSHLLGMFYRVVRLVENGIKPVFVFDGKPPDLKSDELSKRQERREEAQKESEKAKETGDAKRVAKLTRRSIMVTKEVADEYKVLLKLMGIPYLDAPCEAEAQCAALVKAGKVYATATEDMDALTFGSKILIRHLTVCKSKKKLKSKKNYIQEIHLDKILDELEMSQTEFIDLCILLGCDYCDSIKGMGPKTSIELIRKYRSLEKVVENLESKYVVPENWNYNYGQELFLNPEVADPETIEMKWSEPDVEGLIQYLCNEKDFNEERVRKGAKKLAQAKMKQSQSHIGTFFKTLPRIPGQNRKVEENPPLTKSRKMKLGRHEERRNKDENFQCDFFDIDF